MFNLKVKLFEDLKPEITFFIEGLASRIDHLKRLQNWLVRHKEFVKKKQAVRFAIAATGFAHIAVLSWLQTWPCQFSQQQQQQRQ